MLSKLYLIFFVKKKVPIQSLLEQMLCSKTLRFTFFSMTLSKDTCSNKLGLSKSPES